jgi:hypothetical protein
VRRVLLLVVLVLFGVGRASAQTEARVAVRLFPDTAAGPHVEVRVMGLLDDPDWRDAVINSYPVRLEWSVQLWQTGMFGKAGPKVEWKDVIQRKSIMNLYEVITQLPGSRPTSQTFASLDILALYVGQKIQLDTFGPKGKGEWYYRVVLKLSTLTGDEIDKLSASQQRGDNGSELQRAFSKALLNFSLPKRTLRLDSPSFRWP